MHEFYQNEERTPCRWSAPGFESSEYVQSFPEAGVQHLDLPINLWNRNVENKLGFMLTIIG
jgi:hypothetical protein